eukprot:gnl/Dysnectes_brevis/1299_a1455_5051.p1 GENE.gnl/Dysnectes_brevis/1299_a1455_5051~~gnl/Dysnectes_brevis/1299_a1455_5051.p1  ORF type:complete len:187 (+),score=0.06 gnl/Dysnectes_brevis/1299_a1455_5051:36-563(+)
MNFSNAQQLQSSTFHPTRHGDTISANFDEGRTIHQTVPGINTSTIGHDGFSSGVYKWVFRLVPFEGDIHQLRIGAYPVQGADDRLNYSLGHGALGVAMDTDGDVYKDNTYFCEVHFIFDADDSVTLTLDMDNRTVTWGVHDHSYTTELVEDGPHVAAITTTSANSKVTIESFEQM